MIRNFPVVIFDTAYHKELIEHIELMVRQESIGAKDMELLFVTDSIDDLVKHIKNHAIDKFGLVKEEYRPKWWYGENRRKF
ncbi:hypothetical protein [uncultured Salegentibacter sp.]|uniref:hypothetical protein n=1 Tax=uncultured Salegentibacter sp. TaxID=259320 RepID=UPI0030DAF589